MMRGAGKYFDRTNPLLFMKRKEIIMNQTRRLLQAIVENGRMGEDACDQLLRRARDNAIRQELMLEKQHYAEAVRDA